MSKYGEQDSVRETASMSDLSRADRGSPASNERQGGAPLRSRLSHLSLDDSPRRSSSTSKNFQLGKTRDEDVFAADSPSGNTTANTTSGHKPANTPGSADKVTVSGSSANALQPSAKPSAGIKAPAIHPNINPYAVQGGTGSRSDYDCGATSTTRGSEYDPQSEYAYGYGATLARHGGYEPQSDYGYGATPVRRDGNQYGVQNANMSPERFSYQSTPNTASRHRVGDVDAQRYYKPEACVFVANLPEAARDSRLEAEITKKFSQFGTVFIKIRRDYKNLPFAFCQFTAISEAEKALKDGPGLLIEGRPCRVERLKANRKFVIFNRRGDDVTDDEARYQLQGHGEIASTEAAASEWTAAMKTGAAIVVEFDSFDPCREIVSSFRRDPTYSVIAYDLKKVTRPSEDNSDEAWLARYEKDRRSVFVGALPVDILESEVERRLREVMSTVGNVEDVHLIRKDSREGIYGTILFAFVIYSRVDEADKAVMRLHGYSIGDRRIRVERKKTREAPAARPRREHIWMSNQNSSYPPKLREDDQDGDQPITPNRTVKLESSGSQVFAGAGSDDARGVENVSSPSSLPMGGSYGSFATSAGSRYPVQQHGASGGRFPETPQAHGMLHPNQASPYYMDSYTWSTPYLQDPSYGAYYPAAYGYPMTSSQSGDERAMPETNTPTRGHSAREGNSAGEHSENF